MKKMLMLAGVAFLVVSAHAQKYELISPDGLLISSIGVTQGINVTIKEGENVAIRLGNILLVTGESADPGKEYQVQRVTRKAVREVVRPEIREKAETLTNDYNELEIKFKTNHSITFRQFNEGLAYRLSTSYKDTITIFSENLELYLDAADSARFQSSKTFNSSYETPYEHKAITGIEKGKLCNLPLLVEKQDGRFIMVTEADLYNYTGLWLKEIGRAHV